MICAGVRLLVSLPRPRDVELNLEARHVQAFGIRVTAAPRRPFAWQSHAPPGIPRPGGVRRTVIEDVSSLERAWHKDDPPDASGKAVAVNVITARHRGPAGNCATGFGPSEAILSAPGWARYPVGNIRLSFHSTSWLCEYSPYVSETTVGRFRLIIPGSAPSIDHPFPVFRSMPQESVTIAGPPTGSFRLPRLILLIFPAAAC
jgi:hypothetical protein